MSAKEIRSIICLLITSIIWGVAFVAQRVGIEYVGSFTFNGVRFALGTLPLIPVILIFERGKEHKERVRATLLSGVMGGAVLFAAISLQQFGIELTRSAGKAAFITGLYIVIVPVIGIFFREKPSVFVWFGAAFSCAGMYLLSVKDGLGSVELGDILLLACAVIWALHIHLIGRFAGKVSPVSFSAAQFLTCSLLSLICAFIFEDVAVEGIIQGYVPILYAGLLSVGVAYTLQIFGQKHVDPSKAAIIFSLEALFGVLGGAVILHEVMELSGYIGCALIFTGIIVSQMKKKSNS